MVLHKIQQLESREKLSAAVDAKYTHIKKCDGFHANYIYFEYTHIYN